MVKIHKLHKISGISTGLVLLTRWCGGSR